MINQNYNNSLSSSNTFYEPFTQSTYWEGAEINTNLSKLRTYYIAVYNSPNNDNQTNLPVFGKYGLAVGNVDDFSILDLFMLHPYSWINVNLFFNDYFSLTIGITIFVFLVIILSILSILRR